MFTLWLSSDTLPEEATSEPSSHGLPRRASPSIASISQSDRRRMSDALSPVPMATSIEIMARYSVPSMPRPPRVQQLVLLNQFLETRPSDPTKPKVIAVDGVDKNAVRTLIAHLHRHILNSLGYTVRTLCHNSIAPQPPPSHSPNLAISEGPIEGEVSRSPEATAQMDHYMQQIYDWDSMWISIAEASSHSSSRARPCVYLLPLSPLMATLRASSHLALTDSCDPDRWRWLASHWAGHPRPDITINVENIADISVNWEVIRFQGSNMSTLAITKAADGIELAAQQLRRVCFEVEDLLISD